MTDAAEAVPPRWAELPWGRLILLGQLLAFAVPAVRAWASGIDGWVYIPLATLAATFVVGVALQVAQRWRPLGLRVLGATMLAIGLETSLAVGQVVAYAALHRGWELS